MNIRVNDIAFHRGEIESVIVGETYNRTYDIQMIMESGDTRPFVDAKGKRMEFRDLSAAVECMRNLGFRQLTVTVL